MVELRDYQVQALDALRAEIGAGRRRVLLVSPTGSGKTTIAAAMIQGAVAKGRSVLFLAHRKELIEQASARLDLFGVDHGIIKAGTLRRKDSASVQVASVQTLQNRTLPPAHLIIVDEAHRTLGETYLKILAGYVGQAVVGLTATPCRTDGRGLGDVYQALVEAARVEDLVDRGLLVKPTIYVPPPGSGPDLSMVKTTAGDYNQADLAAAVNQPRLVGNIVHHWLQHADNRLTVAFAVSVEHSLAIRDAFRAAGVVAEHIDGGTPELERDRILAELRAGRVRLVSNCNVLTEGWDLPECAIAILARPTKSRGLYLQMAGRVLRSAPGKDGALILDHGGCALKHGRPQDPQLWDLDTSRKREENKTPVKQCPECWAVVRSVDRTCDVCGYAWERLERVGADQRHDQATGLVRLGDEAIGAPHLQGNDRWMRALWVPSPTKAHKQAAFNAIAERWLDSQTRSYGAPWKVGAIAAKYRKLWGVWPRGLEEACPLRGEIWAAKLRGSEETA